MATIVLVHGAWHGGWCWRKLTPLLSQSGHEVYTPTLTGMGERSHLGNGEASIETHVQDILQVLFYEDLRDVILLGHSYGGSIISGIAEEAADCIARLVYLDAFIPRDGDSLFNMCAPDFARYFRDLAEEHGGGRFLPSSSPGDFGVTEPEDVAWMQERLCPVPLSTFADGVSLPAESAERLPRSYIFCAESGFGPEAEGHARRAGTTMSFQRGTIRW